MKGEKHSNELLKLSRTAENVCHFVRIMCPVSQFFVATEVVAHAHRVQIVYTQSNAYNPIISLLWRKFNTYISLFNYVRSFHLLVDRCEFPNLFVTYKHLQRLLWSSVSRDSCLAAVCPSEPDDARIDIESPLYPVYDNTVMFCCVIAGC